MFQYKFSIVMAVYNVEQFLEEAIESVIRQDIGFKENVQIILVDDGSRDSSGMICDKFAEKYHDNIVVIHKENGGVSSARNEGLKHVRGEYVNFMDSDDKISESTLRKVYDFFKEKDGLVNLVSIPMFFFDNQSGPHILNHKFKKGNRIIDLNKEYDCIQLSMSSAFAKFNPSIHFDERIQFMEDAKVCMSLMVETMSLGVVSDVKYFYRRRKVGVASAVQGSTLNKAWYLPSIEYFAKETLEYYNDKYGQVPLYVQFTIMYDLQWHLLTNISTIKKVLNDDEIIKYKKIFFKVLSLIDDKIIAKQNSIYSEHKLYLLSKKHVGIIPVIKYIDNDYCIVLNDIHLGYISNFKTVLEFIKVRNTDVILEGYTVLLGIDNIERCEVFVECNGVMIKCQKQKRTINAKIFDEQIYNAVSFLCTINQCHLRKDIYIKLYVQIDDVLIEKKRILCGKFFPISNNLKDSYFILENHTWLFNDNCLIGRKMGFLGSITNELRLLKSLALSKSLGSRKALAVRAIVFMLKPFFSKDIWLLSDRINKADDNGEALFKYLHDNNLHHNAYFVIQKESGDWNTVKKYGKVLDYHSFKHRIIHLMASTIISSAGDDYVFCPFYNRNFYKDFLWKQKRVFLQHGITKDDISGWLNRYSKNLDMFITAAKPEYSSILEGEYYYDSSVVKLTGFARFDRLENQAEKVITIMPTWRAGLTKSADYSVTGKDNYDDSFTDSNYFKFYNDLINDERLIKCASENGYRIKFMPHPRVITYIDKFKHNELIEFCDITTKYRDIFSQSSLVLTDYSSVAFDFAYLRKPVLYAQFDKEEFFEGQVYDQGYFDYERDGFGEVEYDLESTVNRLIAYMEAGCQLKDKYRKRIDKFFAFNDTKNCERIYKEIIRL